MDAVNPPAGRRARTLRRVVAGLLATALAAAGLIGVAATPAAAAVVGGPGAASVSGYDSIFYVNDLRNRGTGTVISLPTPPGGTGPIQSLTLYDAIQQANALPAGNRVLITVADYVWVPNQTAATPPVWVSPSNAANPAGSWQVGSTASPLLVKVLQAEDPGFSASVTSPEMLTGAAWTATMGGNTTDFDSTVWGSRYFISHDNVTVDLQNRLGFIISADAAPPGSMFAIRGNNVTLRNISTLASGESGIIISSSSNGTIIENSSLGNPSVPVNGNASSTYAIERAIEIFEGASNTTIRNTTFDRNYVAAVNLLRATTRGTISNLTLDHVTWKQTVSASTDLATNYLVATGTYLSSSGAGANTSGLTIQNSTISDWCADSGGTSTGVIDLEYSTHTGVVISGNTFNGSRNCAVNAVKTYQLGTGSSFDIRNNTFRTTATITSDYPYSWIYFDDVAAPVATNTMRASIHDNTFSGGSNSALVTMDPYPLTRVLSVYRNTMSGIGGTPTAAAENGTQAGNPIYTFNANNQVRTAFPAATPAPTVGGCSLTVNVVSPFYGTGGNVPTTDTLWVDVYAGSTPTDLSTYAGRIVVNTATLQAAGTAGLQFTRPYTGPAGYVRLQTMLSDSGGTSAAIGQTSNISRSVQFTGTDTCAPQLWVKQGGWFNAGGTITTAQQDPTSNRFVTFDIAASEAIAAGQLTASDIQFSGTAPNEQVVSLTQVSPTRWQLVAKADGSGTIVPVIPAGAVADPAGNAQSQAANTTTAPVDFAGYSDAAQTTGIDGAAVDRSVTYVAPLVLTKTSATVTEAKTAPVSDTFGIGYLDDHSGGALITDAAGRILTAPTQPLQVCLTNGANPITGDPSLPPPAPAETIAGAAAVQCAAMRTTDSTGSVVVTAVDNLVVDGTRTANAAGSNAPSFLVQSADPQFDGLILGPASGFATSLTVADNDQPVAASSTLALTTDGAEADGTHTNAVTAMVHNASGDPVSNAPVVFDIPSGVTWVGPDGTPGTGDDVAGGPGVTATLVTPASGQVTLTVTSATPGAYPLHARVNGTQEVASSPQTVTFVRVSVDLTDPGSGFTVTGGDVVANGSATHTITVTLRTSGGAPAAGWASALAATASPATGVVVGAFTATAVPGQYTATVTSTVSGIKTIAVTLDDGTVRTVPIIAVGAATASFVAGPPVVGPGLSTVTIDDSSARLADGIAFHQITTVLKDAQGNPVTGAAAQLTSAVAGSPASVAVTAFVESSTVPGTYTALVRSTSAGAKAVTVTANGTVTIGTVTALFAAGAVDLGDPGSAYSVTTGNQVVGSGSHTVTVTLADTNGNPVSGQAAALVATASGSLGTGGITGFAETGTPGTYTATVTSTSSGAKVVSVRLGGAAVTLAGNGTAVFVAGAVDLGDASTSYSVSGGDVTVGQGQHAVTVRLADQYGNPVPGQTGLAAATTGDLGGGSIGAFAETAVPGTYQALISSTVSGGKPITATFGGNAVTLSGNGVASFIAASVDPDAVGTRYTVSTGDQVVGSGSHTITVTLSDALGNAVPGQAAGIHSATLAPLGSGAIGAFTETGTPGTYTATITSTVAGLKPITTTFGADGLQVLLTGNDTAHFVPAPVDLGAGASGFFVSPGSVPVGTGQHTVTVELQDALGNPVPGRATDLLATPGAGLGSGGITVFAETATPGTYTATITSTVAGPKTLSVTLSGTTVLADGNSIALFEAGPPDLAAPGSHYSVSGGSVPVSAGAHALTITLTDQYGNPVAGQAGLLQGTTPDPLGGGAIGNVVEGPTGTYTASITSTVAGDKTISATLDGTPIALAGNGVASFVAGGVDVGNENTRFSVSTGDQPVGTGSHTITVTLADQNGNPVAGQAAGLHAEAAEPLGAGSVSAFTETTTPGTYAATVSSTLSGGKTVSVEFGASPVVLGGNGIASFVAGAVDTGDAGTGYSVSAGQVSVSGGSHLVTVTLADQYGNPVSDQSPALLATTAADLGTGAITGFAETATPGTYTATVTSTRSGDKPIDVTFTGAAVTLRGNGVASFVSGGVDVGDPGTGFSVSTGGQPVGSGLHTITVTLADANGNAVPGQAAGLSAATTDDLGAGTVSAFTETTTPGTYTATVSSTRSGDKTITVASGGSAVTADRNDVAAFVAGGVDLTDASTGYAVSTGSVSVSGGSHTVTITLADQYGNPVSGLAADLSAATVDALGGGTITGFVESGTPGTYTATITSSVAGAKTITAAYAGTALTLRGNDVAVFVAGAVDVGASGTGYSVSTGDQPVGSGSHTVTVTLVDTAGNPVSGQEGSLEAATAADLGAGSVSTFAESATPGTYTATVTSTLAGAKAITVVYGKGVVSPDGEPVTLSGNDVASFVAGPVDLADPATLFSVSTGTQTVVTGAHTVTVTLADRYGNPVPGQAAQLVAGTAADLGTGGISVFTETGTPGTYTASVLSSVAGGKTITVTFSGSAVTAGGNAVAAFVAGAPDPANPGTAFSVSTGAQTVGTGSHTVTVTLADASGNPVPGQEGALAASAAGLGAGGITAFTETATPGTYTATITSTLAGGKTVAVTVNGQPVTASGNAVASFVAGAVDLEDAGSAYSVSGGTVAVGGVHTVTVTLADAFGNPVSGQAAQLAAATADDLGTGTISAFSASGTPGSYVATISSTLPGAKAVTATFGGMAVTLSGNGSAVFAAGGVDLANAGSAYTVSTGGQTVGTGSHTVTVTLADQFGNAVPGQAAALAAATTDPLGAGMTTGFVETGTPGTYTATVTSTVSGGKAMTVIFDGNAVTASGNTTATFLAAAVDLGNAGSSYAVSGGSVSVEGGSHLVTVLLADQYGNPVPGQAGQLLAATADDLGAGSVSAFTETGTPGTYTASVTSSVAGAKTITATFGGDPVTASGNTIATFVSGGVDTGDPGTTYTVSTGAQTVGTGGHAITVTLADAEGNPVAGEAAGLSAGTTDPLGSGSVGAFTETGTAGTYTAPVTSTVAGAKTITVLFGASSVTLAGNGVALFTAAAVDPAAPGTSYTVSVGDQTVGTGTHTVTVTLTDAFGNPVPGQAGTLAAATADALGAGSVGSFTETATPGTYTAPVTSTVAGAKAITSTVGAAALTLAGNGSAAFVAGPADTGNAGTHYTVSTGSVTVVTGSHTVTITLADQYGNPVPGQAAQLLAVTADDLGTGAVTAPVETGTPGTYTATVTSSLAGGKAITVTVGGAPVTLTGNGVATFLAGGVDVGNAGTAYSVSTGLRTVGTGSHTVTVTLADANGNPVSGQAAGLTATTVDPIGTGAISAFAETATPGTYTATVTSTVAGIKRVAVTFGGEAVTLSGNGVALFQALTGDSAGPSTSYSVSTGVQTVAVGSHTVTVLLGDRYGNPVTGEAALLLAATADPLGTGMVTGFVETATPGTYTATVTSTISGGKAMTVTLGGLAMSPSGNTTATFVAGVVDIGNPNTHYTVSGGAVQVGTGSHLIQVQLTDQFGNPASGQAGQLSAATVDPLGTGGFSAFTETATPGTYEATVTSSNAGAKTITVDDAGAAVSAAGNTVATFVAGGVDPGDPATGFSVSTGSQPVGTGSHTITVTLADADGNAVSGQAAGLSATVPGIGGGTISAFTETATPGTYTATVTSTLGGVKTVGVRFGADPLTASGNATAAFAAGPADPGAPGAGYTVSTGTRPVGTGEHTITVTLTDQYGNPVSGSAGSLTAATTGVIGSGAISAFTETGTPGTYTATIGSTSAGVKPVTVTADAAPLTARGNAAAVFVSGPVDPSAAQLTATSPVNADGVAASTITLRLFDAYGNPVTQQVPVGFASTLGHVGVVTFDGAGTYTAPLTSTTAGTATVSATVGGSAIPPTVDVVFTDVTPPRPPVVDPSDGTTVTGCAEPGSTIVVHDASGAVIGRGVAGADCRFTITLEPPQEAGSTITVTATDPAGNVSGAATLRVGPIWMELSSLVLEQGAMQRATGHDFQPGETVSATLQSTPVALGSAVADANGDVVFTFQIPVDFEPGGHSVTLTGDVSGTVSEDFTVVASPGLAGTGSVLALPLLVGAVAALLGGLAALIRGRREERTSGVGAEKVGGEKGER